MNDLPQPLTPAERALRRMFIDGWRIADCNRREASHVLQAMYRESARRRK